MQKTTLLRRLLLNNDVSCVHVNNQQTFVLNEVKTCLLRRALMSKDVYSKRTHACSLFPRSHDFITNSRRATICLSVVVYCLVCRVLLSCLSCFLLSFLSVWLLFCLFISRELVSIILPIARGRPLWIFCLSTLKMDLLKWDRSSTKT